MLWLLLICLDLFLFLQLYERMRVNNFPTFLYYVLNNDIKPLFLLKVISKRLMWRVWEQNSIGSWAFLNFHITCNSLLNSTRIRLCFLLVITSKPKRIPVYNNVVTVVIRCDKSGILIIDNIIDGKVVSNLYVWILTNIT